MTTTSYSSYQIFLIFVARLLNRAAGLVFVGSTTRRARLVWFFRLCFSIMSGHVVAHSIEMHPFSTEVAPRLKDGVATCVVKHNVDVVVVVV